MKKHILTLTALALLTVSLRTVSLQAVPGDSSAQTLEGRWRVERGHNHLSLELKYRDHGGRSHMGFSIGPGEIRELPDGRLELRREAGTFQLTGDRSGTFVFKPNPDFVRGLESRGYDEPGIHRLFSLASLDLTLDYVDEMTAVGHGGDLRQLTEMKIHGVTAEYTRAFSELGLEDLSGRQLVEMKIHGVKPSFLREMGELGYELSSRELVEMKIHGVDPRLVRELAEAGVEDVSARHLVEMEIHGVDPADVREFAESGLADLSPRQLVEMRIHGVRPSFVSGLAELGYSGLSARQLVEMKIHGVSLSFVRSLEEKGYKDLSARELVEMRIHGIPRHGRS